MKQHYRSYAYNAFRENSHVSKEAHMALNKF